VSLLGIDQKKGDPDMLDGRLTVYARVDLDLSDIVSSKHPIASMVNNGLLVVQGNYKDQNNLRDFLKSEMNLSLEEGLSEFLEKLDGLESALDPEKLKEKLSNIGDIQDFIPTPAKIVPFNSEEDVLREEGDIFYAGFFKGVANANLSVNSFPIIYQARFREQQIERVRSEIEMLVSQVERNVSESGSPATGVNVEQRILKDFIPYMLYCRKDRHAFDAAEKQLRSFLSGPQFHDDVDKIVAILSDPRELASRQFRLLELYARKLAEISRENFREAENIQNDIANLLSEPHP
jgi:hypothetical protein